VGVAHGYYKNPDRTAYQFVRHPTTDEMLFRTGDLGRVRPEGLLEILGREDSQVKVNGFRIELGEIEKVLTEYEDVSSAALAVHNNALCAYVVLRSSHIARETDQVISDLKVLCKEKLTEYMIPKHFSFLEELPLSSNGKLQREKLLPPMLLSIENDHLLNTRENFILPLNDLESLVLTLFSTILNVSATNICCQHSTFFESGGNSLSSIQLLLSIRNQFKVVITIQEFFVNPTVLGICSLINSGLQQQQQHSDNNDGKVEEEGTSLVANTAAAAASPTGSALNATTTAKINFIQELQLQKGSSTSTSSTPPLILFNPAGASGLW
jgi:acyl carrier protein